MKEEYSKLTTLSTHTELLPLVLVQTSAFSNDDKTKSIFPILTKTTTTISYITYNGKHTHMFDISDF